jgi:hypothetical protein
MNAVATALFIVVLLEIRGEKLLFEALISLLPIAQVSGGAAAPRLN